MELYTIDTDYINYLKKYQERIWDNEEKGRLRPYVGVVMVVGDNKYYVPLSSPKPKHMKMPDRLDFIRLEHKKQLKAVLNLNNMIPVDDYLIKRIDINNIPDKFYKNLLNVEMIDIRRKQSVILKNAAVVYNKTTKYRNEPQNQKLVSLCYDFLLLEQKLKEYAAEQEITPVKANPVKQEQSKTEGKQSLQNKLNEKKPEADVLNKTREKSGKNGKSKDNEI